MTPEMMMAKAISSDQEKQKIASAMQELSMDELISLIQQDELQKEAVIGPAADIALAGLPSLIGSHVGVSKGRKEFHEKKPRATLGLSGAAKMALIPGYFGYHMGRKGGHDYEKEKDDFVKAIRGEKGGKDKKANGDMLQYFQDHPEKLKEKQERDAKKKEKKASTVSIADAWGRELAHKEKEAAFGFASPMQSPITPQVHQNIMAGQAKQNLISRQMKNAKMNPGDVAAARVQRGLAKATARNPVAPSMAQKAVSGVQKGVSNAAGAVSKGMKTVGKHIGKAAPILGAGLAVGAGAYGASKLMSRGNQQPQMTRTASVEKVAISFNQVNEGSKFVGRASRLWEKHGPGVKNLAGKVGKGARDAFSGAGKRIGNIKDPIARGAALGAATGGVGGAVQGFLDPKEDPMTGKKQRVRTAFRKGLAGAAAGAPTGALFASMSKSSSVRELEKAAAGLPGLGNIGSMARNFVGQMKPVASKAMGAAKPMAQKALGAAGKMSNGQMAGVGALKGGIGGAALGAGAGVGLKAMAPKLQATKLLK